MFCIYCGSQTENATKICDACAAKQTQSAQPVSSPFQPEAPLMTEVPENLNVNEQAPFQPEVLEQPVFAQEPPIGQPPVPPTYGQQAPPTYGQQMAPTYGQPQAPTYGQQMTYGQQVPPVQPTTQPSQSTYNYQWQGLAQEQRAAASQKGPEPQQAPQQASTEHIKALKGAMSSFPAMMCAILLSAVAFFNVINFFVASGSIGASMAMLFTVGVPMILLAAGAWISYLSAKGPKEVPITAGLKMATAVGIVMIVGLASGLVLFFVIVCILAAAGGVASLYGTDFAKFFGSAFTTVASISFAVIMTVLLLAMVAMILCIVFVVSCNKNLSIMRNILMGRTKNVKLAFFPIIWCYVIAACNVIGVINGVDTLISGKAFEAITHIAAPPVASTVVGIFISLCMGASAVFAARALGKCRKDLMEV